MMDFETWRAFILEELEELSDRDFQRKYWNAGDPNKIHSFDDLIERLYDDFDFQGFIIKAQASVSDEGAISVLREFDHRLSKYVEGLDFNTDDNEIIDDPEWVNLSREAARVIDIIKSFNGWETPTNSPS